MQSKSPVVGGTRFKALLQFAFVFAGDMLPYGVIFLLTVAVGFRMGLEAASFFSLAYAYVAITTALVCGPNLLSLRRRMPSADSPGAVVVASLCLRGMIIATGALLVIAGISAAGAQPGLISLVALLFTGRLFETSVDGPATSLQYLRDTREYFMLRLIVFFLISSITGVGLFTVGSAGLTWVAVFYVFGCAAGFLAALAGARQMLTPVSSVLGEFQIQVAEFGKFLTATALYLGASRLHPVIIGYFSGHVVAGQFAMVQNLFAAVALAATGIAGVFFWSMNRKGAPQYQPGVPWRWLASCLPGGVILGAAGGAVIDFLYLRPLGSSAELLVTAWVLCLSTPLLLTQAIVSNVLVLQGRDLEMLTFSALTALLGLLLVTLLIYVLGMVGAALSVGASALLSTLIGIKVVRRL